MKKLLAFLKEDHSLKITVPLPMSNPLWSWKNSTFSKISKNFGKSKKKIDDLYELDNSKQKIFFEKKISKLRKQMSFFEQFLTKVKFFLIDRAN